MQNQGRGEIESGVRELTEAELGIVSGAGDIVDWITEKIYGSGPREKPVIIDSTGIRG